MNRKHWDGLWLTAVLSACALVFLPVQAALADNPPPDGSATRVPTKVPKGSPLPTSLRRRPAPPRSANRPVLVTHEFVDADLIDVIKILAKDMGRNVYIGPGFEGRVTISIKSVPVDGALAMVLRQQEADVRYKLLGYNTLVVALPDKVDCIEDEILGKSFGRRRKPNAIRQEFLLERAPAYSVMGCLQGEYSHVEFIPHPTMNGFYAVGSREDIARLKAEVPWLDKTP